MADNPAAERLRPIAVIAGASGFIGQAIMKQFAADGYEIRTIGRNAQTRWSDPAGIARAIDGAEVLVNLAGKSVNCRYTNKNRDEILRSRVDTTRALRHAVVAASRPPRVWLDASTATIYQHEMDRPNSESDGRLGEGFSVDVARNWERECFEGELVATRRVAMRIAIVLGDGLATQLLLRTARFGIGGTQYDGWCPPHQRYRGIGPNPTGDTAQLWHRTRGLQKFSWIHIDDLVRAVSFVRDRDDISGAVNFAAPQASDNRTLMRLLRYSAGTPFGLPANRLMMEIAMWALRTEPELLFKSRWVAPEVLLDSGFRFEHDELEVAIRDVAP